MEPARIHVLVQLGLPGRRAQPDQLVRRRAVDQFVRHDEQFRARLINHGRAGDADRRRDVTARKRSRRHGRTQVSRPQHGTGGCREGVHRVVLGRHVDPSVRDERFTVELAVEDGRGPGGRGDVDGGDRRCHAAARGVAVIDAPGRHRRWTGRRGGRGGRGRRGGRAERRSAPRERQEDEGGRRDSPTPRSPRAGGPAAAAGSQASGLRTAFPSGAVWRRRPLRRAGRQQWRCRSRRC